MPVNPQSQASIDTFNMQLRSNPEYRAFLQSIGANPNGPLHLSDQQRMQAANWVKGKFGNIGNLQIDPAGNLNQDEGFSKHWKWMVPAAIGAGTLGLGAAGIGPLSGLFGGGGSAASGGAAAGGTLASSQIPASLAMQAVPGAASTIGGGVAGAMSGSAGATGALGGVMPAAAGGGASAARGLVGSLKDNLLSPDGLATAGSIAAMLAGRGGGGSSDEQDALTQNAMRQQAITEARMRRVDPLHEAITQLAFGRLPVSSRQGINLPRVPLPE